MIEQSEKVLQLCKQNYDKDCGNCPLRKICVSSIGYGIDGLNKWVKELNDLAEMEDDG